jgi:hypothetical protein
MSPELRQECIEVIRVLLDYLESEFEGTRGMIGESANVHKRATALLVELKRP